MILCIRYFFEKTNEDYEQYISHWNENLDRIIFLVTELCKTKQMNNLIQDIQNDQNKDILAIRFPNKDIINNNDIIKQILTGEGITHNNGVWYPTEIWIYNPFIIRVEKLKKV